MNVSKRLALCRDEVFEFRSRGHRFPIVSVESRANASDEVKRRQAFLTPEHEEQSIRSAVQVSASSRYGRPVYVCKRQRFVAFAHDNSENHTKWDKNASEKCIRGTSDTLNA